MTALWLLAVLAQAAPAPDAAKAANTQGFAAYKAKDWAQAIALFRQAIAADDSHALAHYNLAATLALMRQQGKTCEFDAYRAVILDELTRAIALDGRRQARAKADGDFKSVHDTVRWQTAVLGRVVAKDAARIVPAVTWYAPAQGAYGPPLTLRLRAAGTGTATVLEIGEDTVKRKDVAVRWRWKGGALEVRWPDGSLQRYTLTDRGTLASEAGGELSDDPSDCDA